MKTNRADFMLSALIEALTIIHKYGDTDYPTNCVHDCLYVKGPHYQDMDNKDYARLVELGFIYDTDDGWMTYRFGSN